VSVDVWFTQDIQQIILAAVSANEEALASGLLSSDPRQQRVYHQGFRAALSTLALALGLPQLPPVDDQEQCTILDSPVAMTALAADHGAGVQEPVLWPLGQEVSRAGRSALVR
jgi:hypothetical protein